MVGGKGVVSGDSDKEPGKGVEGGKKKGGEEKEEGGGFGERR